MLEIVLVLLVLLIGIELVKFSIAKKEKAVLNNKLSTIVNKLKETEYATVELSKYGETINNTSDEILSIIKENKKDANDKYEDIMSFIEPMEYSSNMMDKRIKEIKEMLVAGQYEGITNDNAKAEEDSHIDNYGNRICLLEGKLNIISKELRNRVEDCGNRISLLELLHEKAIMAVKEQVKNKVCMDDKDN